MTVSKALAAKRAENRAEKEAAKAGADALNAGGEARLVSSPAIKTAREIPETGTVTVALKMPNGLILRLFTETVQHEQVMGGGTRPVKVMEPIGDQVRIQGYAVPANKRPRYLITQSDFALTEGVDAKFFKTWWLQNEGSALVKSGLIFCMADKAEAEAKAESRDGIRNGLEPLATGKGTRDPRAGRVVNPNLSDVEPADAKTMGRTV